MVILEKILIIQICLLNIKKLTINFLYKKTNNYKKNSNNNKKIHIFEIKL